MTTMTDEHAVPLDSQAELNTEGVLRKATLADIPKIQKLIERNLDKLLPRPDAEIVELLDTWWVIDEASEIVGCCCLEVYSAKIAELRSLAVEDSKRGHGYGRMLVQMAVAEAERRNIRQVLVVTSTREFFEGLNFGACLNEKYALFWNGTGRG
ncbi:MAG: GNAT family N-acetyltransferase [Anaerolineae bacterium]|nr:GNAT family N-acetyltransferase [Anaerolineae bacterium]